MDFNGDRLGDIAEVISGFKSHKITLINEKLARQKDIEDFIMWLINIDGEYSYFSDGTVLYLTKKEEE